MKTLFQLLNIVVDTAKQDSTYFFIKKISDNTHIDFYETGWDNLYGWITIGVAAIALIVAVWTLVAQMHTEKHTKNTPYKVQEGILRDLPRHLYRNLVCTMAIIEKYEDSRKAPNKVHRYPSEANMLKLQTLPEEILLKMDISEKDSVKVYAAMHETTLLFRNYNNEILSASQHFSRPNIDTDSVYFDYDNLLFKPCYLMKAAQDLNQLFSNSISGYTKNAQTDIMVMASILLEHVLKGNPLKAKEEDKEKEEEEKLQEAIKNLESDTFIFNLFDFAKLKKTEPIERSFKESLFKNKNFNVKRDGLFTTARNLCVKNIDKWEKFKKDIETGKLAYGQTLNKDTNIVNFWNLFKIMCYLDSEAEKSKIGMINVA